MNENIDTKVEKLQPFTRILMTIGELPTSYLMSMTYYEQLIWFTKFLQDQVIPAVNNNATAVEELQTLFVELQTYVNNYFDNLDIQEEINNKLDEMAESGELTEIIAQYLQLAGVLVFDTLSLLKSAENLNNGSTCKILGENSYNDGLGRYYKIRSITNQDTIDNYNIIALTNYPLLVGERVPYYLENRKVIIIGDSYSNHEYEDITSFWYEQFASNLGLTLNTNLYVRASDGAGFSNDAFYNRLYELRNVITDKLNVTDILVVGGLNDRNTNESTLLTKMTTFNNYVKETYINAKVHLVYVGNTNPKIRQSIENRVGVIQSCIYYERNSAKLKWKFIKNTQFILHNYDPDYWEEDGAHPSQLGQNKLGTYITEGFLNGVCDVRDFTDTYYATLSASGEATAVSNVYFISGIDNETSYLTKSNPNQAFYFTMGSNAINCNGTHSYEIGTLSKGYFMGTGNNSGISVPIILSGTINDVANTRVCGTGKLYMEYGKLYLIPLVYANNSVVNTELDYIFIPPFDIRSSSYYA